MKKIKRILTEKSAFSSLIYSISILMFLLLITILVITTIEFRTLALEINNTVENSLEEYITEKVTENMNSIKNGTNYILEIDTDDYIQKLSNQLNLDSSLKGTTGNGRTFEIANISTHFIDENKMNVKVIYTLNMPIIVGGTEYTAFNKELYATVELKNTF